MGRSERREFWVEVTTNTRNICNIFEESIDV